MKANFNNLIDLIHNTKDKGMLEDFLLALTTPHEQNVLARRVQIVQRLLNGEPHQEIAADLGVGVSTVTRGSRELARGRFKILRKE